MALDFSKIDLNKKIRMGLGVALLVLAISSIVSYYSINKLIEQSRWLDHTNGIILNLENILSKIRSAETSQRGYLLTGDASFLKAFNESQPKTMEICDEVQRLTADNPIQQLNMGDLRPLIIQRYAKMQKMIDLYKIEKKSSVEGLMSGSAIMDACVNTIANMQAEEHRLLKIRTKEVESYAYYAPIIIVVSSLFAILVSLFSFYFISKDIRTKEAIQHQLSKLNTDLEVTNLEINNSRDELNKQNFILAGTAQVNDLLRGEKDLHRSGDKILDFLCLFMNATSGVMYLIEDDGGFVLSNIHGLEKSESLPNSFDMGQGLLGEAAHTGKVLLLDKVPSQGLRINTGLASIEPSHILIAPFTHNHHTVAVIELLSLEPFAPSAIEFIGAISDTIAIFIKGLKAEAKMMELLEETQKQAEELEVQQEELKQTNEVLEEQTRSLKKQQDELQVANEELEQQTKSMELKNRELENAQIEVEKKTIDLQMSNKYKSEFLANMSHELRTPLNSLLILSKDLADNKRKNLEAQQVESAQIIYNSGQDLLQLINEVLDLSKIEAGKMELNVERVGIQDFMSTITRNFKPVVEKKNLKFVTEHTDDVPSHIYTDRQRLEQIVRNFISNAIKFTERGSITFNIRKESEHTLALEVIDTGIGISPEKHAMIFEAFQQADGSTARKYGGTGLGLSISKELAALIKGRIFLHSKPMEGSTFGLVIPIMIQSATSESVARIPVIEKPVTAELVPDKEVMHVHHLPDDRDTIEPEDKRVVLIIEDDESFAKILCQQAQDRRFKVLIAATGEDGLFLAEKYLPHAIILDLGLPYMSGQSVLSALKNTPALRHIPVHIISASDRNIEAVKSGAVEYLRKPVNREDIGQAFARMESFISRKMKNLLIVEDDENSRKTIKILVGNGDVKCWEAGTGAQALKIMREIQIDCLVLDLGLPDMSGFELIELLHQEFGERMPPVVVHTGKDLTKEENDALCDYAQTIIVKGAKSEERLLDETALFLHRTVENLPESKREVINNLYNKDTLFHGKRVLLVDDDMRNIFALAKILKDSGLEVLKAENGLKALDALNLNPDLDLVLMDIMMPEMDGYEAMRQIRQQSRFKELPIIALTAKAMKEDRSKCIDAGASDYISKPIDMDRLLSLMRIWIKK